MFLDTETTGLPKYSATDPVEKWPRVVQLAWSLYSGDGDCESRNSFIIYPGTDFSIPLTPLVCRITDTSAPYPGLTTITSRKPAS
jgi:hypothetical protein